MHVPYLELFETLQQVLIRVGFKPARADLCARLFAETTRDGVYSHGLNRFPLFISMAQSGVVDIHAEAKRVSHAGVLERWNGNAGAGNLNAYQCMNRAIDLSREHGI